MTKWDNNCSVVLLHDQKIITDFNDNVKEVLKIINLNQLYSSHHMYINLLLEIRFVEKITNIKINWIFELKRPCENKQQNGRQTWPDIATYIHSNPADIEW